MKLSGWMRGLSLSLALVAACQTPVFAGGAPSSASQAVLTIGVDYPDPANQQPDNHRVFEYADFFPRTATVHHGDVIDFRSAPGAYHVIGLAPNDAAGRAAYPVAVTDQLDATPAAGSGQKKIGLGPSNFSVTGGTSHGGGAVASNPNGPPVCGEVGLPQPGCSFNGGDDVEIAGPVPGLDQTGKPAFSDWRIQINAPPGTYSFLCWIHPHMSGSLTVVPDDQPVTSQAAADAQGRSQFEAEQAQALQAEQAANKPSFSGGAPGSRTYTVKVGISGGDKVRIDEMLPSQPIAVAPGDTVQYQWLDPDNVHTVTFPAGGDKLPEPFGFNCGSSYQSPPAPGAPPPPTPFQPCLYPSAGRPDFIADPGNAPSGTTLTDPTTLVDSGTLIGTGYGISPSMQSWVIKFSNSSKPGAYVYQCTVHDWMQGTLNL